MQLKGKETISRKRKCTARKNGSFSRGSGTRGERERCERESVSKRRACGGCLGVVRRRRTQQAAKSLGELQASEDPGVSEWGNLIVGKGY